MTDEIKIYPMLRDILGAMMKHLPTNYHGKFTYTVKFKDGIPIHVDDVWGERSIDVKRLIEMLDKKNRRS